MMFATDEQQQVKSFALMVGGVVSIVALAFCELTHKFLGGRSQVPADGGRQSINQAPQVVGE